MIFLFKKTQRKTSEAIHHKAHLKPEKFAWERPFGVYKSWGLPLFLLLQSSASPPWTALSSGLLGCSKVWLWCSVGNGLTWMYEVRHWRAFPNRFVLFCFQPKASQLSGVLSFQQKQKIKLSAESRHIPKNIFLKKTQSCWKISSVENNQQELSSFIPRQIVFLKT